MILAQRLRAGPCRPIMPFIALQPPIPLSEPTPPDVLWRDVAAHVQRWLAQQGHAARDAVVLLPFAALLPPLRRALAASGGWMPRVETPLTLAATLAPPPATEPGGVSGDAALDALAAAALLRGVPAMAELEAADRRSFDHVTGLVVDAAQALRRGALAQPPARRAAWWAAVRGRCQAPAGPGAREAALLQLAVEWAASTADASGAAPAATDALFGLSPSAWIVVRIGGRDAFAESLAEATGRPGLVIDADALDAAAVPGEGIERWLCDDAEAEAWAAASRVIEALAAGHRPVGLVALDREAARRIRALLDRADVAVADETGWALSTTGAAARVMALLRAAAPGASADARLEWLKTWPPALARPRALEALEAGWRKGRRRPGPEDREAADRLWDEARQQLAAWAEPGVRTLADWLALLRNQLQADGSAEALQADPAGEQLWQALAFDRVDAAWQAAAAAARFDLHGLAAWLADRLEAEPFVPPSPADAAVVLTPLARAIGRPFAQVVVPGADAVHLGAPEPSAALVGDGFAEVLGLPTRAQRRERQRLAFVQLLRVPRLALLRRRLQGEEPLAASPEVELLALQRARAGRPLPPERTWSPQIEARPLQPVARPMPRIGAEALPRRLSASTIEALRDCPYRFFARSVLRLSEADELDAELAKRDYGNWLHAVLHRFHAERVAGQDDAAALQAAADAQSVDDGLDPARWLPYRASFSTFAAQYLQWLAAREAEGYAWLEGEVEREVAPEAWAPQTLYGRLDRLDTAPDGTLQVIDYKTGQPKALKDKAREPLEDTQLAVYAALEPRAGSALYLALDEAKKPEAIAHQGDVAESAAVLVDAVGRELARLREGEPLPALGEGQVCNFCEARGLCRRDHWSAT
jgi:ATP-dependent helicase/nuclease subunit B